MKKKKAIIVALLIVALIVWMASFALADGGSGSNPVVQAVTLSDLGVSDTGLLPSNPFYFSEEWLRGFQKIFTKGPLDTSKLELQILNNKAAELLSTSELSPVDAGALGDAVTNYGNELQTMDSDLKLFNGSSAEIDSFLGDMSAKLFMHYQILEEIKVENGDINGQISSIQEQIDTITNEVPSYMSDSSQFGATLESSVRSQADDLGLGLRSLSFIDGLEMTSNSSSTRAQLDQVRQDQALAFEGRLNAGGISSNVVVGIMSQLPVSDLNKIKLTGDLRDFVLDSGLKLELTALRSALLAQASSTGEVSAGDASNEINYADKLMNDAGSGQQPGNKDLLGATVLLSQAKTDLTSGSFSTSFGEAGDAASIADGLLFNSSHAAVNSTDNISNLSDKLSALEAAATGQGLSGADDPKLFALFAETTSILSNSPSVNGIYQATEVIDEASFAINNAQGGVPSALIPVPGKNALQNTTSEQSLSTTAQDGTPQYCPEVYKPVCGSDATTYTNKCFQNLVNVSTAYKGECRAASTSTAVIAVPVSITTQKISN